MLVPQQPTHMKGECNTLSSHCNRQWITYEADVSAFWLEYSKDCQNLAQTLKCKRATVVRATAAFSTKVSLCKWRQVKQVF